MKTKKNNETHNSKSETKRNSNFPSFWLTLSCKENQASNRYLTRKKTNALTFKKTSYLWTIFFFNHIEKNLSLKHLNPTTTRSKLLYRKLIENSLTKKHNLNTLYQTHFRLTFPCSKVPKQIKKRQTNQLPYLSKRTQQKNPQTTPPPPTNSTLSQATCNRGKPSKVKIKRRKVESNQTKPKVNGSERAEPE